MDIPYVFLDGYCASPMGYHSTITWRCKDDQQLWICGWFLRVELTMVGWYPLVNVYIAVENDHAFLVAKSTISILWPFSIAIAGYSYIIYIYMYVKLPEGILHKRFKGMFTDGPLMATWDFDGWNLSSGTILVVATTELLWGKKPKKKGDLAYEKYGTKPKTWIYKWYISEIIWSHNTWIKNGIEHGGMMGPIFDGKRLW